MTTTKPARRTPPSATSVNKSIDALIASVANYKAAINAMSKSDYAYHIYKYASRVNAPFMVLPSMFNYRFGTELTDFTEVVDLMKSSSLYAADNTINEAGEKGCYSRPVCIYLYMRDFWQQALPKLQANWEVEPDYLIRLIVDAQHRNNYSAGWSYHLAELFYAEIDAYNEFDEALDIGSLISIEDRAYREDMTIDYPQEFLWLTTISMGLYLNTIHLKSHVEQDLTKSYRTLYGIHKKTADAKMNKLLKPKTKSKKSVEPVNLTANEAIILKHKDENDYVKKAVKRAVKRMKI